MKNFNLNFISKFLFIVITLAMSSLGYSKITKPKIHSTIMLDAYFYGDENANNGAYNNMNRFQVRKATMALEGKLEENLEYIFEFGIATCVGTGNQLQIMEAKLDYFITDNIRIGMGQGHVLKGFTTKTECSARLSLEKPEFLKSFGACHPLGVVTSSYFELGEKMGLELELAALNGEGSTLNGEHEYNAGMIFDSPLSGLSFSGFYNQTEKQYYDENYEKFSANGFRAGGGANYLNHGFWLTSEYYLGEGFATKDQKMGAWYAQVGYEFFIGAERLNAVQPYVKYTSWIRDKKSEIEHNYFEIGANVKLTALSKIKIAYENVDDKSEEIVKSPNTLSIRLQSGF